MLILLMLTLPDNRYPWLWRRCWQMFRWAERWGRHSQPFLDRHLGMRARKGFHLHLRSFHHMLQRAQRYCTQYEIQVNWSNHWSRICNEFEKYLNLLYIDFIKMSYLLQPQLILAGLYGSREYWSRDPVVTKFVKERCIIWWAITDL